MKCVCLVVMLFVAVTIAYEDHAQYYCGRRLYTAFNFACGFAKTADEDAKAELANNRSSRLKRGIVEDCCYNPCTQNQMLEYCQDEE